MSDARIEIIERFEIVHEDGERLVASGTQVVMPDGSRGMVQWHSSTGHFLTRVGKTEWKSLESGRIYHGSRIFSDSYPS